MDTHSTHSAHSTPNTSAEAPIFPHTCGLDSLDIVESFIEDGISKREYFAALAMQGLMTKQTVGALSRIAPSRIARDSVTIADALIYELSKPIDPIDPIKLP